MFGDIPESLVPALRHYATTNQPSAVTPAFDRDLTCQIVAGLEDHIVKLKAALYGQTQYEVTLREEVYYTVKVWAHNEEAASDAAREIWVQSENPTQDFAGTGYGVTVVEAGEVK